MKDISFLLILLLVFVIGCKTIKPVADVKPEVKQTPVPVAVVAPPVSNFSDQSTWVLGYFSLERLTQLPHSVWYNKEYDDYQINSEPINRLLDTGKDNLTIKIVMGTWCPDSRREVPRFMRILDIWRFPMDKVKFIGVDKAKLSPIGEYDSLNIKKVPTFIIYKNNIEAGRIIENPVTSLEQDILNILTRNE